MTVEPAQAADAAEIRDLLRSCGLPVEDIGEVSGFLVARSNGALVGTLGLERAEDTGLLRSLSVKPEARGKGVARSLCEMLLGEARLSGVRSVYLLTTDTQSFFRKLGFADVPRESAPEGIRQTAQFRTLCPASATLMARKP
jgi:amino-acid N-acetyltransferase